jgi:hypothetical protein
MILFSGALEEENAARRHITLLIEKLSTTPLRDCGA